MKTIFALVNFPEELKLDTFYAVTIGDKQMVIIDADVPAPQKISPEEAAARLPIPLEQLDSLPYRYETTMTL